MWAPEPLEWAGQRSQIWGCGCGHGWRKWGGGGEPHRATGPCQSLSRIPRQAVCSEPLA